MFESSTDVADLAVQAEGVLGHVDESVAAVERGGLIIDRVDYDETGRGVITGGDREPERFGEETTAQLLALVGTIDGEPGDQDCRNRVTRHSPCVATGS